MTTIIVVDRSGTPKTIDAVEGRTLMETIRDAGLDELTALCGGCCSCATCHVYVDHCPSDGLPTASDDEDDLLDSSMHRRTESRLSCQLIVTEDMNGLRVTIAPPD